MLKRDAVLVPASADAGECIDRRALLIGAGISIAGFSVPTASHAWDAAANTLVPALDPPAADVRVGRRIDVHHHPVPPAYLVAAGSGSTAQLKQWSVQQTLDDMDAAGVATAMLSIPAAGLWPPDVAANRRTARACNEFMAQMARDHPGRFGVFAMLPLSDVEGSLGEVAYALDVLKADGIGVFTSYRDRWLGDAAFDAVFEELDRRKAVVYTHPTTADCCARTVTGLSPAMIEYGTDTTRAIANWVFSGSAERFSRLTLIFSHAGGTMPFLIERFEQEARAARNAAQLPEGILPLLRRFYYDTAQAANPVALGALRQIVPLSQVLFGSDFPYRKSAQTVAGLLGSNFTAAELETIYSGNALRLFPKFAGAEKIKHQ